MSHANAPLTPEGRLRLVLRCAHRPIAHVAAEAGISRQCLSKWKARYDKLGEVGLLDRSSVPHSSPTQLDAAVVKESQRWLSEYHIADTGRWGEQKAGVWQDYADWLVENGVASTPIVVEEVFTNRFLP